MNAASNETRVRWGILGTAGIARKNWRALRDSGNSILVAVASRDVERSRRFIRECQVEALIEPTPKALGSYEDLLASPEVDAVYIPLPTGLRKEWVLRAAAAGKHILCEKPCAPNAGDLREMLAACQRHPVQFMDGVMFMHSRRLERLRQVLDDEESIGPLRRITSAFSFHAPSEFLTSNIRTHSALEPHGCLGDLGWYCIRLALWAMKRQMPLQVTGRVLSQSNRSDSPLPVPTEFSGELFFAEGVSTGFYCSFITENQQWANLSGVKGYAQVPDFVLPFAGCELSFEVQQHQFRIRGGDFRMEPNPRRITVDEYSHNHPTAQEANLFRNFSNLVRSGKLDQQWPEIALKTQLVLDACLESARNNNAAVRLQTSL